MRYLEDFPVGVRRELGTTSITEDAIVRFAEEFDPQPFHVDREAAKAGFYGGVIASGWHTCSLAMRLIVDGFLRDTAALGSPGVDEIRWLKPVRPGDTLVLFSTATEMVFSKSKPDRGILTSQSEMVNQSGETVLTMRGMTMMMRRPATSA